MNELTFFNLFLLIYFDFYYLNFEKKIFSYKGIINLYLFNLLD